MSVTYLPPRTNSVARTGESLLREVVHEGPAYARSGNRSTRWHLIRSAEDHIFEGGDGEIWRTMTFWCGPMSRNVITADEPPENEPVCGTCFGRREGWQRNHGLLFTPHGIEAPKVCPASRHMALAVDVGDGYYRCLACGCTVRGWTFGSPYCPDYGLRTHAPGSGLVEPCPWHAWRDLVKADGPDGPVAACRCLTIEVPA